MKILDENGKLKIDSIRRVAKELIEELSKGGLLNVYDKIRGKITSHPERDVYQKTESVLEMDQKKSINNIFTDMAVADITSSEEKRKLYVNLTFTFFDEFVNRFARGIGVSDDRIIFIYKGGNVLRFIFRESLREIPASTSFEAYDKICKYFKMSDNDYSILLDDTLDDYDNIFKNITAACFVGLAVVRKMCVDPNNMYWLHDFYNLKEFAQKKAFEKYIPDINEKTQQYLNSNIAFISHGPTRYSFVDGEPDTDIEGNYRDVAIFNNGNHARPDQEKLISMDIPQFCMPNSTNPIRLSWNEGVVFDWDNERGGKGNSGTVRFNLVRTKFMFPSVLSSPGGKDIGISFSGEHIDISIPYKSEFHPEGLVMYRSDKYNLSFRSYNFSYYIKDLERMIFQEKKVPWDDEKYAKRVARVVYLYCFDMLFYDKNNDPEIKSIYNIISILKGLIKVTKKLQTIPLQTNAEYVNLEKHISSPDVHIKKLFDVTLDIREWVMRNPDQIDMFNSFLDAINDICIKMMSIFVNLHSYVTSDAELKPSNIYNMSSQLGGSTLHTMLDIRAIS